MKVCGIVAEYSPFHSGHAYQAARTRSILTREGEETGICAVMSGCWTQQGRPACADKQTRTRLALAGGVDLVLELPVLWSCSSAESFARGAVFILEQTGILDALSFGSETDDVQVLVRTAEVLDSREYRVVLHRHLRSGGSFPACRQRAVAEILGEETAQVLSTPNSSLGVEYIRALRQLGSSAEIIAVLRTGARHDEPASIPGDADNDREHLSATALRSILAGGDWELAEQYLPAGARRILEGHMPDPGALKSMEWAMLTRIRSMKEQDWAALPDSAAAEGLPKRLVRCAGEAKSIQEFLETAKTKRYTWSRLSRLLTWSWLGLTAEDITASPPYIRVLGFNARGREMLREMKKKARLPVITKPASVRGLGAEALRVFELESGATDRWCMLLPEIPAAGRDWRENPVMVL